MKRISFLIAVLALGVLVVLTGAAPVHAQETRDVQAPEPPGKAYAKTPDRAIPYRDFGEPYARFFESVVEFRGTGRDTPYASPAGTLRIGLMVPTGAAPDADIGGQMRSGVVLAFEQANAAGGYNGSAFELVERQDSGLWGASSNEMVAFKYVDDVLAVIGSIDGANTHIALRVALKIQMPMINTATTDPTLTETNIPWLLRCMADDRQQGYALAHHIFHECAIERVAAFRVNDRFGRTGIGEFRDAARRLKHPLRVEMRWAPGDRDFSTQLDRIAETDPQAIVLWGNATDTAAVVKEIRRRDMPVRIFGCDRLVSRIFLEEAGEAAEGVVGVATYDPTREAPELAAFVEAFSARFGHQPDAFAAHAYDGANILIAAVREAGPNRARIRDALYALRHYDGATGKIEFDTTLNDVGAVYIAVVKGGRFVYNEVDFTNTARAEPARAAYRTLAQSPPTARTPARMPRRAQDAYAIGCFLPLDDVGVAAVRGLRLALADDAALHPDAKPIKLLVRDARDAWGDNTRSLVDLVFEDEVLAIVGSTERRGTHLAEILAAKMHFPVISLCANDPSITSIPLPWVFNIACETPEVEPAFARRYADKHGAAETEAAAFGFDAGKLIAAAIRSGADHRLALRNELASGGWHHGVTGVFRLDALGNRIEWVRAGSVNSSAVTQLAAP